MFDNEFDAISSYKTKIELSVLETYNPVAS